MKIKAMIEKHKTELLMFLAAFITFCTSLTMLGGKIAVYCTIIIAIIELLVYYIKNGLTETFLNMCVTTVKMIVDVVNGVYTVEKKEPEPEKVAVDETVKPQKTSRRKKVKVCILTEEMIREQFKSK